MVVLMHKSISQIEPFVHYNIQNRIVASTNGVT